MGSSGLQTMTRALPAIPEFQPPATMHGNDAIMAPCGRSCRLADPFGTMMVANEEGMVLSGLGMLGNNDGANIPYGQGVVEINHKTTIFGEVIMTIPLSSRPLG